MAPPAFTLEQIINQLHTSWGGAEEGKTETWQGTDIDYAMPDESPKGANGEEDGFMTMTATQKAFAREAFEMWDDLIAINLNETTSETAKITLAYSTNTDDDTYTSTTVKPPAAGSNDQAIVSSRLWFSPYWEENQSLSMAYGNRGLENYIHEIGHSLGLSHPGSYNAEDGVSLTFAANAEYSQDTQQWAVMSYFKPGADGTAIDRTGSGFVDVNNDGIADRTYISSPLLHDILAIQAKYGADYTTRAGDTVYGFHSNAGRGAFNFELNKNPVIAIWDGGGNDWLNTSGFSQNQRIDLHQGAFSDVGALTLNVAIAYGVDIENATGGSGNDSITGNDGDNYLAGLGGNDSLVGLGGADLLHGNEGHDTLDGGIGFIDTLYGDAGDDTYIINDFDTIVEFADHGTDTVRSTLRYQLGDNLENLILEGTASINGFGNALSNVLVGNSGNNYLQGFSGHDHLFGGAGNDYYELGDATMIDGSYQFDTVNEAIDRGIDTVSVASQVGRLTYVLDANIEYAVVTGGWNFNLVGNELNNSLVGNAAANVLTGNAGSDAFNGLAGYDTLNGGAGDDTYILNDLARSSQYAKFGYDGVNEAAAEGTDLVLVTAIDNPDTFASIETYKLSANVENATVIGTLDFNLTGNELNNRLQGNTAFNVLAGGAGNDTYVLADLSQPQSGQYANFAYDTVTEAADAGIDTVVVTAIDNPSTFSTVETYTLGANIENGTIAGTLAFNLTGNALNNRLEGNAAFNVLTGGTGDDTYVLTGLAQRAADPYALNSYDTVVEGAGAGTDTVLVTALDNPDTFSSVETYTLGANIENGTVVGGLAFNLTGNTFTNNLTGNSASNTLNGGAGNDFLRGGLGSDTYVVDSVSDYAIEAASAGIDRVYSTVTYTLGGNVENLILSGSAAIDGTGNALGNSMIGTTGANRLFGLAGDDGLDGGAGNDVITGGLGKDNMGGGAGADLFDFNSVAEMGKGVATRDSISDFTHLSDRIDLSTIDANGAAVGHTFSFLTAKGAAFTGAAGQLHWFQADPPGVVNDRTIVEGDVNGDKVADFQIQLLGLKTLTAADFVL